MKYFQTHLNSAFPLITSMYWPRLFQTRSPGPMEIGLLDQPALWASCDVKYSLPLFPSLHLSPHMKGDLGNPLPENWESKTLSSKQAKFIFLAHPGSRPGKKACRSPSSNVAKTHLPLSSYSQFFYEPHSSAACIFRDEEFATKLFL